MVVVKRGLYYLAIALSATVMYSSAVIPSYAAPNFNNKPTLEDSLQDCTNREFDSMTAQKQIDNKCVFYRVSSQEELISIYERIKDEKILAEIISKYGPITGEIGHLIFIPKDDFIEKWIVKVIPSMLSGERLYKEIEDINISLDEERYLRSLFLKYKKILTQKEKQLLI